MTKLLTFSRWVDRISEHVGRAILWLILAAVLISAGNAIVRKAFRIGSNAFLDLQWYLYSAVFLLGAGYTLLKNAHVRIDVLSSRLSARTRAGIEVVGIVVFLIPLCLLLIQMSWPLFANAWQSGEMSQNAGGLIRWPVYLLMPLGMGLLLLQSLSQLVKQLAFLRGLIPDPHGHHPPGSDSPAGLMAEPAPMEER